MRVGCGAGQPQRATRGLRRGSRVIGAARLSDRGLAITQLPAFEGHYHGLETSIEAASDQIEAVAETARISVETARTKATVLIGLAALLTVLAAVRRGRVLKHEIATRWAVAEKLRSLAVHDDLRSHHVSSRSGEPETDDGSA